MVWLINYFRLKNEEDLTIEDVYSYAKSKVSSTLLNRSLKHLTFHQQNTAMSHVSEPSGDRGKSFGKRNN